MTSAMTQTTIPLLEIYNREDPTGKLYPMVEMLARTDQLLLYSDWTPCNNNLSFKGTRDSTEPTITDAGYDEGAPASYGTSEPYEEPTAMTKDWMVIDRNKLHDRGTDEGAAFATDESRRHFNAFRKGFGDRVFYGDRSTYPKRIRGFTCRSAYNTVSSSYVYDNSGGNGSATANKTSVYVIRTGRTHFQFTYPQHETGAGVPDAGNTNNRISGSAMGFTSIDYGLDKALDANNYEYPAYKVYWQWRFGMVVHDPRAVARICNISTSGIDEVNDFTFNHLYLIDVLGAFKEYFGDLQDTFIVVPTIVETQIAKAINNKSNVFFSVDDPFGRPIGAYNYGVKVPICLSDSITHAEAKVA